MILSAYPDRVDVASVGGIEEFNRRAWVVAHRLAGELILASPLDMFKKWPSLISAETYPFPANPRFLTTEIEYGFPSLAEFEETILCTSWTNPLNPKEMSGRCSVSVEEGSCLWPGFLRLAEDSTKMVDKLFLGIAIRCEADETDTDLSETDLLNLSEIMAAAPGHVEVFIDYSSDCEMEMFFDLFTRMVAYYSALALETHAAGKGVALLAHFQTKLPRRTYSLKRGCGDGRPEALAAPKLPGH